MTADPAGGGPPPRVLHLLVNAGETRAPLNEHVLPAPAGQVGLCSYFDPKVSLPGHLPAYSAGGRLRGFYRALREASRSGGFTVVHAHSPNVAVQYLLFRRFLGVRSRPAAVLTVHTSYPALSFKNLLLLIPAFLLFDVVVFCSQASRDSFPRPMRALCGRRGCAIPNGVDLARLDRSLEVGTPARRPPRRILSVGRLIAVKDPLTLVRAFARLDSRDAELDMVGIGPLDGRLRSEAEALGMAGRVRLRGLLPREEVYAAMRQADVFVSSSRGEGLPVAVLEAMACGCPMVLTDIGPHRELVPPGGGVPLVPAGDIEALARALAEVLDAPPERRSTVGDALRTHVAEHFSLDRMTKRYLALYQRLVAGGVGVERS